MPEEPRQERARHIDSKDYPPGIARYRPPETSTEAVYRFIKLLSVASIAQIAREFSISEAEVLTLIEPLIGSQIEWGSLNAFGDRCVQLYD